jgi:hypothetical protein
MRQLNLSIYSHESHKIWGETTEVSLAAESNYAVPNLQAYDVCVQTSIV